MSTLIRFITFLIFIAIVLMGFNFSNYNTTEVPLWLGIRFEPQRVGVWIMLAFSIGGLTGLLLGFGFFKRIKYKVQLSQLRTQLKQAEQQITALKTGIKKD